MSLEKIPAESLNLYQLFWGFLQFGFVSTGAGFVLPTKKLVWGDLQDFNYTDGCIFFYLLKGLLTPS